MDYIGYASFGFAFVAFLLSLYNFGDKYIKEHYPRIEVKLNTQPFNLQHMSLSVTNHGLKAVVLCSYFIRVIKPPENDEMNKKIRYFAQRGFDGAFDSVDKRLPYVLEHNKPFVELIDDLDPSLEIIDMVGGQEFELKFQIIFSDSDNKKYYSNVKRMGFNTKYKTFNILGFKIRTRNKFLIK